MNYPKYLLTLIYIIHICIPNFADAAHPIACIINDCRGPFFSAKEPFKENTDALYTWLFQSISSHDCPPLIVSKHLMHDIMAAGYIFKDIIEKKCNFDIFYDHVKHIPYLCDKQIAQKHFENLTFFAEIIGDYYSWTSDYHMLHQKINSCLQDSEHILHEAHAENSDSIQFYLCAYCLNRDHNSITIFDAAPSLYIILKNNKLSQKFKDIPYPQVSAKKICEYLNQETYAEQSSQDLTNIAATSLAPYLKNAFLFLIGHGKSQDAIYEGSIASFSYNRLKKFFNNLSSAQALLIISCHAGGINSSWIPAQAPCDVLILSGVENTIISVLFQSTIDVAQIINNKYSYTIPQPEKQNWSLFAQELAITRNYTPQAYIKLINKIAPYKDDKTLDACKIYLFKNKASLQPARPLLCSEIKYITQNMQRHIKQEIIFQKTPAAIILEPALIAKTIKILDQSKMPDIIVFERKFLDIYCLLYNLAAPFLHFEDIVNGFLTKQNPFRRIFLIKRLNDTTSTKKNLLIATHIQTTTDSYNNFVVYYDTLTAAYHYLTWTPQKCDARNKLPEDYKTTMIVVSKNVFNRYFKNIIQHASEHKKTIALQRIHLQITSRKRPQPC